MNERMDHERMTYVCNNIMENKKILVNNAKLWSVFLDNQLTEFVILYNFNFYQVSNRFQDFISMNKKYDFSEDEIRRHWSFIHAARYLNIPIDDKYYDNIKSNYKNEENEKNNLIECNLRQEEKRKKDQEEHQKLLNNMEKYKYERFNLITIGNEQETKEKVLQTESKLEDIGKYETDNIIDETKYKIH